MSYGSFGQLGEPVDASAYHTDAQIDEAVQFGPVRPRRVRSLDRPRAGIVVRRFVGPSVGFLAFTAARRAGQSFLVSGVVGFGVTAITNLAMQGAATVRRGHL
jgi:hypothetical protein